MREFAEGLGIEFEPVWALMLPVEKILGSLGEETADSPLTGEDRQLIDNLALPLPEALAAAKQCAGQTCNLRDAQISMDFQGNVQLCCGIFDARLFTIGNYLDLRLGEIQSIRETHPMCGRCMGEGAHIYLTYRVPTMEELVLGNLAPEEAELLSLRQVIARKRLRGRLEKLYGKFFSRLLSPGQKAALVKRFERLQHLSRERRTKTGKG
jgi:hypothetical protein